MWISPYKYVLSLGHLCSDINQSILSAVLPFLIATYHYDYTTAAMLVTVSNVFGSFVQPFIGMLSDKKNKPLYMTLGVLLASSEMAVTGFISNFFGLWIVVIMSGIGVAMFHPQAAKLVNSVSSKNAKGKGMSIFSFGGLDWLYLRTYLYDFFNEFIWDERNNSILDSWYCFWNCLFFL